jgi:hypothetical protein
LNQMEWLVLLFVFNEYFSECIVWFKNINFIKNIWKLLIRHNKYKMISFSHCNENKNLIIYHLLQRSLEMSLLFSFFDNFFHFLQVNWKFLKMHFFLM